MGLFEAACKSSAVSAVAPAAMDSSAGTRTEAPNKLLAELLTAAQGAAPVLQIQVWCFVCRGKKGFVFAFQMEELEYKKVSQWGLNVPFIWILFTRWKAVFKKHIGDMESSILKYPGLQKG